MNLTEKQALWAYATMMNTRDAASLEPLLAEDFHYASQWVLAEIESKDAYLDYINSKLTAIRESGSAVWAEIGWLDRELPGPCVVMAQGNQDNLIAVVFAKVKNGELRRLDLCAVPSPQLVSRTGRYPGLSTPRESSQPGLDRSI